MKQSIPNHGNIMTNQWSRLYSDMHCMSSWHLNDVSMSINSIRNSLTELLQRLFVATTEQLPNLVKWLVLLRHNLRVNLSLRLSKSCLKQEAVDSQGSN